MLERGDEAGTKQKDGGLNEHHKIRLGVPCQYIHELLSDVSDSPPGGHSPSPSPRYIASVSPAQVWAIEDYIGRSKEERGICPNIY